MSATRRGERIEHDVYLTPDEVAVAIVARIAPLLDREPERILEPSAGAGAFVRAARARWPDATIHAMDIRPDTRTALVLAGADRALEEVDFLTIQASPIYDLVLGNPPFGRDTGRRGKKGKPIMEAIFHEHAAHAVAMTRPGGLTSQLLRLNVLGSLGRLTYWQAMPLRHIDVLVPRFSFTGGGTDSIEYGNFRFMPGWAGAWTGDVWGWRGDA